MTEASTQREQASSAQGGQATGAGSSEALALLLSRPGAACPHCRYSLSGLAGRNQAPDLCPECGGGLAAGLVGSTGPHRLRALMALMFAWLAFAGSMNSTRWALNVHDFLERQAGFARAGARPGSSVVIIRQQVLTPGVRSGVPREWWLEVGGWGLLGAAGVFGLVAVLLLKAGNRRGEKRLMTLLVLGFLGYWGYHGIQFGLDLVQRLGA